MIQPGTQAIKQDTVSIRDALPTLQASAVAIKANIDTLHAGTLAIKDDATSIQNVLPPLPASTIVIRDAQSLQQDHTIMQ